MKKISKIVTLFFFLVLGLGISSIAEEITLTTYYPAPYGAYEELRAKRMAVGTNYLDASTVTVGDDNLIVEGSLGIGTTVPLSNLHIEGSGSPGITITDTDGSGGRPFIRFIGNDINVIQSDDTANEIFGFYSRFSSSRSNDAIVRIFGDTGGGAAWGRYLQLTHNGTDGVISTDVGDIAISPAGNVGIGIANPTATLHVNGNVKIETVSQRAPGGNVKSLNWSTVDPEVMRNNDIAELFDASEEVEVGEVLVVDDKKDLKLRKSNKPYEKGIIGIVSGSPAILFEGSQIEIAPAPGGFTKGTKPPVALAGRIPCKVSIENGPIERGDLLTSSSTPGHAMKATDRDKSFGAVLGKALEPFNGGPEGEKTGKIIVLVTLQ